MVGVFVAKYADGVRVAVTGASNDWTVQTLDDRDGIGRFNFGTFWQMPSGVNGSATGDYFQNTTGTKPIYTNSYVGYSLARNGVVQMNHEHNISTTAGTSTGIFRPTWPVAPLSGAASDAVIAFYQNPTGTVSICNAVQNGGSTFCTNIIANAQSAQFINSSIALNTNFAVRINIKCFI
jgi:hypothetical protein